MGVCDETKPYIFISYSHKDTAKVVNILNRLRNAGYNVWYDEGIDPGTEWDENIARHVQECTYFIAFVSNGYINSKNCKDELNYSRDLDKEQLLVYLEDVELPGGMAMRMNRIQAIWWNKYTDEEAAFEKLFSASGIEKTKMYEEGSLKEIDIPTPAVANEKNITVTNAKSIDKKYVYIGAAVAAILLVFILALSLGGNKKKTEEVDTVAETVEDTSDNESEETAAESGETAEETENEGEVADETDNVEYQEITLNSDFANVVFEVPSSVGFVGYPNNRAELDASKIVIRKDGNYHSDEIGMFLFGDLYVTISEIDQSLTKFDIGYAAYDENDQLIKYAISGLDNELTNKHVADEGVELAVGNKYVAWGWLPYGTKRVRIFAETADGENCYNDSELATEFNKHKEPHTIGFDSEFGHLDIETPGLIQDFDYKSKAYLLSVGNARDINNDYFYKVDMYFTPVDDKPVNTDENNYYADEKMFNIKTACFDADKKLGSIGVATLKNAADETLPITMGWIYKYEAFVPKDAKTLRIYSTDGEFMNSSYKMLDLGDGTTPSIGVWEGELNVGSANDHNFRVDYDFTNVTVDPDNPDNIIIELTGKNMVNANGNTEFVLKYELLDGDYNVIDTRSDKITKESGYKDGDGLSAYGYKVPKETRIMHLFGNYLDGRDCYND